MERFLNSLLGGLIRDLVNRLVNWGFDRAARGDKDSGAPNETGKAKGESQPMARDLGDKARQLERMLRRLGC